MSVSRMFNGVHIEHGLALHDGFTYHATILPWPSELRYLACRS